jgi:hypothetical protein
MQNYLQVKQDVIAEPDWEPSINAAAIGVEVKDGVVTLPIFSKRTDGDIARTASNVLEWTTNLPKDRIKVMVEGGWISRNATWRSIRPGAHPGSGT